MKNTRVTLNSIINFVCILLMFTAVVCYCSVFWKFDGGVASIHNLIGFPHENAELQNFLSKETAVKAFVTDGSKINLNKFVFAPVIMILGGIFGMILFAIKRRSAAVSFYGAVYGVAGVLTFALIDIFRTGTTWKFQLAVYALIALLSFIEILFAFVLKKEPGFETDAKKITTPLIGVLGTAVVVLSVVTACMAVSYKNLVFNTEQISLAHLENQIKEGKLNENGEIKVKSLISKIETGTLKVDDKNEALAALKKTLDLRNENAANTFSQKDCDKATQVLEEIKTLEETAEKDADSKETQTEEN